ncbi:hypothetical protein [Rugosimonospora africana]|uniref:Uncharacterized protein n=1 Tax=Rugosimonospora africana TaxID=556532 RepID=A0A8J3R099_9ACTN|nr:hypothetical protein [Rugosimonospora africana]GIH19292.1 hypothetical protein Raf01_74640 [Rugosimonospora africana]
MRPYRVLLLVSTVAGGLSVIAALFSGWRVSAQCGVVALAVLVGYVTVAGRAARTRVRWALAAGIGLLAVVIAVRLFWYPGQTSGGVDWFAYLPASELHGALLDQWRQTIDGERIFAVGRLLGVLCFAVAVVALPGRHPAKPAMATAVLSLLLLAAVGADVWSRLGDAPVLGLLGVGWPALLVILVALGIAVLAGGRAGRVWLLPAGAFLVAAAAAVAFDDLAGSWSAWRTLSGFRDGDTVFAVAGMPANASGLAVSEALVTAMTLAGPALLAIGALRASRDAVPAREE